MTRAVVNAAQHPRFVRYVLLAIVIVGGVDRLLSATAVPLIFDEYQWVAIADHISFSPVQFPLHGDAHPVATAYLIAASKALGGPNLVGYRLLSVVAGTALIWIVWRLGTRLSGAAVGLSAAAMVAANEYLFGISRLATEKGFALVFAAAGVLAFLRAVERDRTIDFAAAGVFLGLALMTKETIVLWIPLLAWELGRRRGWRALARPGPVIAATIIAAAIVPDLTWNLFLKVPTNNLSDRGLGELIHRFGLGWSFGPTALFLRPAYQLIEGGVSEYPAMSMWPGGLLLGGATLSLFTIRTDGIRLWLILGWVPFLFFSVCGNPSHGTPEFWWADLSVVPFVMVTAALLTRLSVFLPALAVCLSIPGLLVLSIGGENCYPTPARRSPAMHRACEEEQRSLVGRFVHTDPDALTRFGPWRLPAAAPYRAAAAEYMSRLTAIDPPRSDWWPTLEPAARDVEIHRMGRLLRALEDQR